MASWTAAELLKRNLVDAVAHVVPCSGAGERLFQYQVSRTADDLRKGAKSRYYPVELSRVIAEMKRQPGRYAVVGIPASSKRSISSASTTRCLRSALPSPSASSADT